MYVYTYHAYSHSDTHIDVQESCSVCCQTDIEMAPLVTATCSSSSQTDLTMRSMEMIVKSSTILLLSPDCLASDCDRLKFYTGNLISI